MGSSHSRFALGEEGLVIDTRCPACCSVAGLYRTLFVALLVKRGSVRGGGNWMAWKSTGRHRFRIRGIGGAVAGQRRANERTSGGARATPGGAHVL